LVQRFLDLVHIKNPILDPDTLWSYVRHVTEDGFQWDPPSCLVVCLPYALFCTRQLIEMMSSCLPALLGPYLRNMGSLLL
jgi:hypothetical protein